MICCMCQTEKPPASFSTLARPQAFESTGAACTGCYWWQLVLVFPEYQADGTVIYRPYKKPRLEYIDQIRRWLPAWVKQAAVLKKYASLGSINKQIAPFWEFAKGLEQ